LGKKENATPTQFGRRQGWWQGQIQSPKFVFIVLFYSWTVDKSTNCEWIWKKYHYQSRLLFTMHLLHELNIIMDLKILS